MIKTLSATIIATSILLASAAAESDYEAEARRAIEAFDLTGMVAAVIIDGEIVYFDAFGKAEEGTNRPVTTEMLFPIASISKAFTTMALAILVDRGEVEWDKPVRTYIPEFEMSDPWITEHFTVRDAVTHRSGLPLGAGDLLFCPDGKPSVDDFLAALPHLKPSTEFRSTYAYDNLLYVVAGEIVARVSGESWADFVTDEIFEPIGMTSCAADRTRIKAGQDVVRGHERAAGAEDGVPVDERQLFPPGLAAAGGINCPAGEMMKWAKFWLDGGVTADGERLITEEQAKELWTGVTPQALRSVEAESGLVNLALYALGWVVHDFEGTLMVTHSGGAPGVVSNFILLPEKGIGIFAAANDYRGGATAFTYQVADGLIEQQDFDFVGAGCAKFASKVEAAKTALSDAISRSEDQASPTLPYSAYAGTYRDPWYGGVRITHDGDGLAIDMSRSEILDGPLIHYDGDQFVAIWPDRSLKADAFVTFIVEEGQVTGMAMKAVSDITDFSFDFHDLNLVRIDNQ